jgi:hypothetical protein
MRRTRVLVLYNRPVLPAHHPDVASEREVLDTAEVVARHLAGAGFEVVRLGVGHDPDTLLAGLRKHRP